MAEKFNDEKTKITDKEQNSLLQEVFKRARFKYTMRDMLQYLFKCVCCRKSKKMILNPKLKKHVIFEKGTDKLMNELDCITLLKSIRQLKLFTQVFLTKNQKLMMKFQRKNVIDSDTSSSDSDNNNQDTLKLLDSKNIILKQCMKKKINNAI